VPWKLSDRPLLDTRTDALLFIDRNMELAVLQRAARQGLNSLVVGERGMGKTSLLRQLVLGLRTNALAAVFVDARAAGDPASLLELVAHEAGRTLGRSDVGRDLRADLSPPGASPSRLLELVRDLPAPGREDQVVVVLDNLTSELGREIFGRLRDELWQRPVHWAVAVDELERAGVMTPPADSFFDPVVVLKPLGTDASLALLRARLPRDGGRTEDRAELPVEGYHGPGPEDRTSAEQLRAIVGSTGGGTPRQLLALARRVLLEGHDPSEERDAEAERGRRLAELGRAAAMLVAELEAFGRPVSASDRELLATMGWTRGRATQVLKSLEGAGLVETVRGEDPRQVLYSLRRVPA
jgi:hypothetical protein